MERSGATGTEGGNGSGSDLGQSGAQEPGEAAVALGVEVQAVALMEGRRKVPDGVGEDGVDAQEAGAGAGGGAGGPPLVEPRDGVRRTVAMDEGIDRGDGAEEHGECRWQVGEERAQIRLGGGERAVEDVVGADEEHEGAGGGGGAEAAQLGADLSDGGGTDAKIDGALTHPASGQQRDEAVTGEDHGAGRDPRVEGPLEGDELMGPGAGFEPQRGTDAGEAERGDEPAQAGACRDETEGEGKRDDDPRTPAVGRVSWERDG